MLKKKLKKIGAVCLASVVAGIGMLNGFFFSGERVYAGQLLGQTDFENGVGLPWHVCESAPGKMDFDISGGVYKITIVNPGGASNGGEDRWDCQFRHRGITITSGNTYKASFEITASNDCTYYTKIGDMSEPFTEDWHGEPDASQHESFWNVQQLQANQTKKVEGTFTAGRTAEVEWAFHIGGDSVPAGTIFTFDNMSLECTSSNENDYVSEEEWVRSDILTNQLGYFSDMKKRATLLSDSDSPVKFELVDSSGKTVFEGKSVPKGFDEDSGDKVHLLDFSDYKKSGKFYLQSENGAKSREFQIGAGELYSYMLYDSLNYFYQNRSGIDIESQYIISGDGSALARAAGHPSDIAAIEQTWGYSGSSGTQDVTGGWYDAGDHGKYVVNGGISLWTMQNQYEMAVKRGDVSVYADGTMSIPENGNGYPDLLDEARYELEWMFKMMVKDGDYSSMVYHKVHDIKWTALALAPADDPEERIIKPPTTAATLNTSACAAQAYRLWKDIDKTFAEQCLKNAVLTYEAAKKHPDMYAPLNESVGGGPYGDDNAKDEFYWAACELYLATEDKAYLKDAQGYEDYLDFDNEISGGEDVDTCGSFNWGNVSALGNLSLALYEDKLDKSDFDKLKENIANAADKYAELTEEQGYGQPYEQSTISFEIDRKGYSWGSNSFVVNNSIILAYAYELTGVEKYLDSAVSGMDYILGRNPVDYSYVTGYGSHAVKNPHHRWWSYQADESFPSAPAGVLVGGPNSGMQDPWVRGSGWKPGEIAPAKCYMDNIEAWSVNECTINWNTPLAWLAAYLANENGGVVITHGSIDASVSKPESADNNSAAGNYKENNYESSESGNRNDSQKKSDFKGGLGIVPVLAGLIILSLIIEIAVFLAKKNKGNK